LHRISLAFRAFFALLFHGELSAPLLADLRLSRRETAPAPVKPAAPAAKPADGALQLLGILQRDSRLVDFVMEDISGYADDQIGAAVRDLHDQPVIDGVEGTFTKAPTTDPNVVKFVGNVPAKPPSGGLLRHKGWRAAKIELPGLPQDPTIIAAAEIEIE